MTVHVTREDIVRGGRSGGDNPVSHALLRETSQAWVVFGGTMAYARSSPHHVLMLPYEVSQRWRLWAWEPFEFEVQWSVEQPRPRADQRQRVRRAQPRFGHDRRARDRRCRNRRHGDRRGPFDATERRAVPRRDADREELVVLEISVETSGIETSMPPGVAN